MNRYSLTIPRHLLVVCAFLPELAYLRKKLSALRRNLGCQLTLTEVGIGLVEAAIGTTRAIERNRPDALCLIGTAGLYADPARGTMTLGLRNVALVRRALLIADPTGQGQAYLPSRIPGHEAADPSHLDALTAITGLPLADVVCPVGITGHTRRGQTISRATHARLENLESYAVFRAAHLAQIPCFSFLGISNHVGPQGHAEWKKHGAAAARAGCQMAEAFFNHAYVKGSARVKP